MRGEPGVVVGFFDEVFRPGPLVVKPGDRRDRLFQARHEHAVAVAAGLEQLILFDLTTVWLLVVTQRDEAASLGPALRLVEEFALRLRVGLRRGLPVGLLQLLDQAPGFARHDHELTMCLLVGCDRFPAIKSRHRPEQECSSRQRAKPGRRSRGGRQSLCPRADRHGATRPSGIRASRRGRLAAAGSCACPCFWGCSSCGRPSAGRRGCARWCRCPGSPSPTSRGRRPRPVLASVAEPRASAAPRSGAARPESATA